MAGERVDQPRSQSIFLLFLQNALGTRLRVDESKPEKICEGEHEAFRIQDFMERDYNQYRWSIPTLDRRLRAFGIYYVSKEVPLADVKAAVQLELDGPGKLLGYRAMNLKLRTEYDICVPRKLAADVMWDLDPDGVQARNVKRKRKLPKKPFVSSGPGWTFSRDGHDKMMGFQNLTFPLGIYGFLDTFSRKIMFLKVWDSNSDSLC